MVKTEKARREDELTEVQKVQLALDKAVRERDDYQQKYQTLLENVRNERLTNALSQAAKDARHPEDVVTWARSHAKADLEAMAEAGASSVGPAARRMRHGCLTSR